MKIIDDAIAKIQTLLRSGYSLSIGYSGGKDSTCVLVLTIEAVRRMLDAGEYVPQCYVTTSNTRREMPEMEQYMLDKLVALSIFIARNNLPFEILEVEPSLSGRFTWTCIGRGKLPRYVGQSRDCARDEKIVPQQKAIRKIQKDSGGNVVMLVGSRFEESTARANNMAKFKMDSTTLTISDGMYSYAPISYWELDDVWDLLVGVSQNSDGESRYFRTFVKNFDDLVTLYRDANEGLCGVIVGDSGAKSGCGSRFGCAWCLVNGERDKSLESLLDESERYMYMEGLSKFRKFLYNIRWDMTRRDWRGRCISEAGFMKVTPDYFSPRTKRELLRYLITLDVLELERAKTWEQKWNANEIEHTEENRVLCGPMFNFVTWDDIVAIEFQWSLTRDFNESSPAARDWIDIYDFGVRYHIPDVPESPRVTIPSHRWFDVNPVLENSISGIKGLLPHRDEVLNFSESKELEVELGCGFEYLSMVRSSFYKLNHIPISEFSRVCIHKGWIKMQKRDFDEYDKIARRSDYIYKLMIQECPTTDDEITECERLMTVDEYLRENSISDQAHEEILSSLRLKRLESQPQQDIFGAESIASVVPIKKVKIKASDNVVTESLFSLEQALTQQSLL
ncbi:hypothetical protein C1E47_15765 [Vibrio cholerae]|nr:hypothetical protein [Vibrio cholerae]TVN03494.1 hypothetical protein FPV63_12790 [Vibrio cholerae]